MSRRIRNLRKRLKRLNKIRTKKKSGIERSSNKNRYKNWRKAVYIRDKFTCQKCGRKEKLNAHHIRPWSLFPLDRYRISNGVTLCIECHKWVHEPGNKSEYLDLGHYE